MRIRKTAFYRYHFHRVDDRTKTAECSVPDTSSTGSSSSVTRATSLSSSASEEDPTASSPLYQTSQIIDIDSEVRVYQRHCNQTNIQSCGTGSAWIRIQFPSGSESALKKHLDPDPHYH